MSFRSDGAGSGVGAPVSEPQRAYGPVRALFIGVDHSFTSRLGDEQVRAAAIRRAQELDRRGLKIPVLIGGGGEKKTLKHVAKHGDIWHGFGDPEVVGRKVKILDQHCADVGRDPAEIERSCGVRGEPDELGPQLLDLGVTTFTVGMGGPDYDLDALKKWIAWRDKTNA